MTPFSKTKTPAEAAKAIKSGNSVYIQGAGATPSALVQAMVERADELEDITLYHLHTEDKAEYLKPEYENVFHLFSMFLAPNSRQAVYEGRADFIPVFLSEIPILFRRGKLKLDVALVQVSPPDKHGYCSLGISVEACHAAIEVADHVIAQINPRMPRTHGDGLIHMSKIHTYCYHEAELPEMPPQKLSDVQLAIGKNVASLVEDRATLQLGIGAIPEAALKFLKSHKDLGLHTEMFSDGVLPLVDSGVINGKYKKKHPGLLVTGFMLGSRKLYDFADDNPLVRVMDSQYVNSPSIILSNPKVTSINSAVEIDITGQVCADSVGTRMISGVGGQMDFLRAASLSEGGKPIIALPSTTKNGDSKLVPVLREGAGVVTTRAHVHYVITEYGVADLYGKSLKQRARLLVDIAHPAHRESLEKAAFERFKRAI
ncbi:MAG: acetyl-CoA hydrolase/transferase C-terminal domain-containing protein [Bacteroidota bacterium]